MVRKDDKNVVKVILSDEDKKQLDALIAFLCEKLGVEVSTAWLIRNVLRLLGEALTESLPRSDVTPSVGILISLMKCIVSRTE